MHQPRLLARGLLVSFLLIGLLSAPGALTFTWAGAAAVEQAESETATTTETSMAMSSRPSAGKFTGLRAAPLLLPVTPHVVISEFRSLGPSGPQDELIELFNATSAPVSIAGWTLWRSDCSDASLFYTMGPGITLLSGQHYLIGGMTYVGAVAADVSTDIGLAESGGVALRSGPLVADPIVDQVGTCAAPGYVEGTPLTPLSGSSNQSHQRALGGAAGSCLDSDNNSADFALISPSDPESLASGSLATKCHTIQGSLGAAGAGATLSYTDGGPLTATADSSGNYLLSVRDNWADTVTPSKVGYTFTPTRRDYRTTPVTADLTGQDYTAVTRTISGNVVGLQATERATLTYTDGTVKTVLTDLASGTYSITVPYGWSGTVTPSTTGYTFTPPPRSYNTLLVDVTGQDYTALPIPPTNTPVPGRHDVVINEVAWAGTGHLATDQWIELHNNTGHDIDLHNWTLRGPKDKIGTPQGVEGVLNLSGTIVAGGYYLIAHRAKDLVFGNLDALAHPPPVQVDEGLNLDTCSGCGDILKLQSPSLIAIDTANQNGLSWPAGNFSTHGSMERYRTTSEDSPTAWVTFVAGSVLPSGDIRINDIDGTAILGTPGQANWATIVTVTPSPAPTATKYVKPKPPVPTPFAHMVINEFLPRAGTDWNRDGAVNVYDEFIEIQNLGPIDLANLAGWKLDDAANPAHSFTLPSMKLKAGERYVFYRSTTNIPLEDSGGTVRLLNPGGVVFDARSYGPVSAPDVSRCRIPDGRDWYDTCFPTPGNENSLTRAAAALPPIAAVVPPPCLLPDTAPAAFRLGECAPYGSDWWNRTYWDDQAGNGPFLVQDVYAKWKTFVR